MGHDPGLHERPHSAQTGQLYGAKAALGLIAIVPPDDRGHADPEASGARPHLRGAEAMSAQSEIAPSPWMTTPWATAGGGRLADALGPRLTRRIGIATTLPTQLLLIFIIAFPTLVTVYISLTAWTPLDGISWVHGLYALELVRQLHRDLPGRAPGRGDPAHPVHRRGRRHRRNSCWASAWPCSSSTNSPSGRSTTRCSCCPMMVVPAVVGLHVPDPVPEHGAHQPAHLPRHRPSLRDGLAHQPDAGHRSR